MPRTGVGHGQHDILARNDFRLSRRVFLIQVDIRGLNRELPTVRHRVAGVYRQIENRNFELVRIGLRAPYTAAKHGLDGDLLAKGAAKQVGHSGDQASKIEGLRIERLLPRECEKPLGQRSARLAPRMALSPPV